MTDDSYRQIFTFGRVFRTTDGQIIPLAFKGGFSERLMHLRFLQKSKYSELMIQKTLQRLVSEDCSLKTKGYSVSRTIR